MGHRLSKIYTRTGDAGTTAVSDGKRISKSSPRIKALGALDCLNAHIGIMLCEALPPLVQTQLERLQHILFDIGGELSMPELVSVTGESIKELENQIDLMNESLEPLKEFILPGGSKASAQCHLLRTETRSIEIQLIELHETETLRQDITAYVNRLSDWFFVAARYILLQEGKPEVLWKNPYSRPQYS